MDTVYEPLLSLPEPPRPKKRWAKLIKDMNDGETMTINAAKNPILVDCVGKGYRINKSSKVFKYEDAVNLVLMWAQQ